MGGKGMRGQIILKGRERGGGGKMEEERKEDEGGQGREER
jgi:hypothetical protein